MSAVITELTHDYSAAALALVCEEFSAHSPLHRALGITSDEYRAYLTPQWDGYAFGDQSISLMALKPDTKELMGCLLAVPFQGQAVNIEDVPPRLRSVTALIQQLERNYEDDNTLPDSSTLLVDLAVVKDSEKGNGYYKLLRHTVHHKAKDNGFTRVLGELSSAATQAVCVQKMGHRVLAEVLYADFVFEGVYPFAEIKNPQSIQLVEHMLHD